MVDPLPGGIDDSAGYVYNPLKHKSDADLMGQAAAIQEELQRRQEEARRPKFPLTWDGYRTYCTKDDRGTDALDLRLPDSAFHSFSRSGMEITMRVIIQENGDTAATHIQGKGGTWIALESPLELN